MLITKWIPSGMNPLRGTRWRDPSPQSVAYRFLHESLAAAGVELLVTCRGTDHSSFRWFLVVFGVWKPTEPGFCDGFILIGDYKNMFLLGASRVGYPSVKRHMRCSLFFPIHLGLLGACACLRTGWGFSITKSQQKTHCDHFFKTRFYSFTCHLFLATTQGLCTNQSNGFNCHVFLSLKIWKSHTILLKMVFYFLNVKNPLPGESIEGMFRLGILSANPRRCSYFHRFGYVPRNCWGTPQGTLRFPLAFLP